MNVFLLSIAAFATAALAHGGVIGYTIQGAYIKGYES
jgi:hypothetical protein